MDRSWIFEHKFSDKYKVGVQSFMNFVHENLGRECKIRCPCLKCVNFDTYSQDVVEYHLFKNGICSSYTKWVYHGEPSNHTKPINSGFNNFDPEEATTNDERDAGMFDMLDDLQHGIDTDATSPGVDDTVDEIAKMLERLQDELYPGCANFSTLEFITKLLHVKVYNRWSNKSFDMLLGLLNKAFPKENKIPKNYYEAMKMLQEVGLGYESIHACKYDCCLFWKEFKDSQSCPVCGTSRWKVDDKKIPWKVLRYFPIKPRLQRLFLSRKTAKDMRWHHERRVDDGVLRHAADGDAWKDFDQEFKWFAAEIRNARFGISADGANPYGNMSTSHSMWPVMLVPYNLPPWECMKEPFIFMALLIPGPRSPGKDIHVYLQPLIDELKELWEYGVKTWDSYKKEYFQLHAAVIWTISDLPAYGDLSAWVTKGYLACPVCNKDTSSTRLRSKICYTDHRRFLPQNHSWRRIREKFNGKTERRMKPRQFSGSDLVEQLAVLKDGVPGKHPNNKKRKRSEEELNWTRKPILFELPYWPKLKLRYNLDVMHVQKNIFDNVAGTTLNLEGRTKDTFKARQDLEDMNIRKELWLKRQADGSFKMPPAAYTISKEERKEFFEFLKSVKFPDGYASNISRCVSVDDNKMSGLKSHDCHVMLQRVFPVGIRKFLRKDIWEALDELGNFFQQLCCKTLKRQELEKLESDIIFILCKLEKVFPPAFFDVMVHLAIHLPGEAILGGPVQYRWMFPFERFLGRLKGYVRNRARPEGSIAETYISNECLTFVSRYLSGIETRFDREERNNDGRQDSNCDGLFIFSPTRPFGSSKYADVTYEEVQKMHWYVLTNCEEVDPYIEEHKEHLRQMDVDQLEEVHKAQFSKWFLDRMMTLRNGDKLIEQLYYLARGPDTRVRRYTGCIVNGVRFHTHDREKNLKSQNSGVVVEGNHDGNQIEFFGVVQDIIELEYIFDKRVVLFKCDWYDLDKRKKGMIKEGRTTSIKTTKVWYKNDPFALALQANQVFYLLDLKLGPEWRVVQRFNHRHLYDCVEKEEVLENEEVSLNENVIYQDSEPIDDYNDVRMEEEIEMPLNRDDIVPEVVTIPDVEDDNVEHDMLNIFGDDVEDIGNEEDYLEHNADDSSTSDGDEDFY